MSQETENPLATLVTRLEALCLQNAGMHYLLENYWPEEEKGWRVLLGEYRRAPKHADDVLHQFETSRHAIPRDPLASEVLQFAKSLLQAIERTEKL